MYNCVECEEGQTDSILCARCEKALDARIARHALQDSFQTVVDYLLAGSGKEGYAKVDEDGKVTVEIAPEGSYKKYLEKTAVIVNAVEVKEVAA